MSGRNAFRGPGKYNLDLGIYKTTKVTERLSLQLRGELYNAFNHSNLYVVGSDNDVSAITFVSAKRGYAGGNVTPERRNIQLALKLIF